MKKLASDVNIIPTSSVYPQFEVTNLGRLVPLLPSSCQPISEHRWKTKDHDNNALLLELSNLDDSDQETKNVRTLKINKASKLVSRATKHEDAKSDSAADQSSSSNSDPGSYVKTKRPLTPHLFFNSSSNSSSRPTTPRRRTLISPIMGQRKTDSLSDKSDSEEESVLPMPKSMPLLKPELYTPSSVRKRFSSKTSPTANKGFSSLTLRPERRRKPLKPEYFDFTSPTEEKKISTDEKSLAVFYV